jgi:hypothetical protein
VEELPIMLRLKIEHNQPVFNEGTAMKPVISYLENFLANVVINAAHMKVPSIAWMPATNLKSPKGL